MKTQPLTNIGGDARENLNFSGFNPMKAYIAACRHYSDELGGRWEIKTTATSQANLQLPANLKNTASNNTNSTALAVNRKEKE